MFPTSKSQLLSKASRPFMVNCPPPPPAPFSPLLVPYFGLQYHESTVALHTCIGASCVLAFANILCLQDPGQSVLLKHLFKQGFPRQIWKVICPHNRISISHVGHHKPLNVALLLNLLVNYNYILILPLSTHPRIRVTPGKGHYLTFIFRRPTQYLVQSRYLKVLDMRTSHFIY